LKDKLINNQLLIKKKKVKIELLLCRSLTEPKEKKNEKNE
jgi:hypothetical protein